MIHVKTEDQRIPMTVSFVRDSIADLDREIRDCDYMEDPYGNLVYSPNCYAEEKRMFEAERRKLEIILNLLTREPPFSVMDW